MNIKKQILTCIISCLIILFIFEILFFQKSIKAENLQKHSFINIPQNIKFDDLIWLNNDEDMKRRTAIPENKETDDSILLLGCSFAYSYGLKYEDSLHYKLSQKLKIPVNLRAACGAGPNETLFLLSTDKFYEITDKPKYIIYLFIENHFSRMFSRIYSLQSPRLRPLYNYDENYNKKEKLCWYKPLFLSHIFKFLYREKITLNYGITDEELLFKTLVSMKKEINKKWENTQFIFIRYSEPNINKPFLFSNNFIEKLYKQNIIYIDADEIVFKEKDKRLVGEEYMQKEQHPSPLAYELFSQKLAEHFKNNIF